MVLCTIKTTSVNLYVKSITAFENMTYTLMNKYSYVGCRMGKDKVHIRAVLDKNFGQQPIV
jgi:hypothetical protein